MNNNQMREFIKQQIAQHGNQKSWEMKLTAFLLECPTQNREEIRQLIEGTGRYNDDLAFGIAHALNRFCNLDLDIQDIEQMGKQ